MLFTGYPFSIILVVSMSFLSVTYFEDSYSYMHYCNVHITIHVLYIINYRT
jgi:hypothetical protein